MVLASQSATCNQASYLRGLCRVGLKSMRFSIPCISSLDRDNMSGYAAITFSLRSFEGILIFPEQVWKEESENQLSGFGGRQAKEGTYVSREQFLNGIGKRNYYTIAGLFSIIPESSVTVHSAGYLRWSTGSIWLQHYIFLDYGIYYCKNIGKHT